MIVCVRERERVCARYYSGFVFKKAPQSTADQKDEAPKPWALLHYPQCSARWLIYTYIHRRRGENERKMVGLNVSPHSPKVFLFLFLFISPNPSEFKSLLSQKGKKNETVLCVDDDRKLYCDMLLSWLWEPHGCTSLCLCRKGKKERKKGRKERKEERKEAAGTDSPQCGKKKRCPAWQVWALWWEETERERVQVKSSKNNMKLFIMW